VVTLANTAIPIATISWCAWFTINQCFLLFLFWRMLINTTPHLNNAIRWWLVILLCVAVYKNNISCLSFSNHHVAAFWLLLFVEQEDLLRAYTIRTSTTHAVIILNICVISKGSIGNSYIDNVRARGRRHYNHRLTKIDAHSEWSKLNCWLRVLQQEFIH
jgi:hypothetical protein